MSEIELKEATDSLLLYINKTPEMISLLYDLDMLPEQLMPGSHNWYRMLLIASWYRMLKMKESENS